MSYRESLHQRYHHLILPIQVNQADLTYCLLAAHCLFGVSMPPLNNKEIHLNINMHMHLTPTHLKRPTMPSRSPQSQSKHNWRRRMRTEWELAICQPDGCDRPSVSMILDSSAQSPLYHHRTAGRTRCDMTYIYSTSAATLQTYRYAAIIDISRWPQRVYALFWRLEWASPACASFWRKSGNLLFDAVCLFMFCWSRRWWYRQVSNNMCVLNIEEQFSKPFDGCDQCAVFFSAGAAW